MVAFVGGATNASASASTLSVTHGLTILAGDLIVACVNGNNTTVDGITDNNGSFPFTQAFQEPHVPTSNSGQYAFFTRVAGSSEPSSYTFDQAAADRLEIAIAVFRGVDDTSHWDVAPSASTRNFQEVVDNSAETPSLTTTVDGAFGIAAYFLDSTSSFSAYTNSYTNEVQAGTHNQAIAMVSREFATAGNQGATAATISAVRAYHAHQVALNPAAQTPVRSGVYDSGGNTGTTWTVPLGATATSGNLLVAMGAADKDQTFVDPPTGWTRIAADVTSTAGVTMQCIYKISDGTETGVNFEIGNAVSRSGIIAEFESAFDTLDVAASASSGGTAVTSQSSGTTGTTSEGTALAVAFFASDSAQNVDLGRSYTNGFFEEAFTGEISAGTPGSSLAWKQLVLTQAVETTFSTTDTGDQQVGMVAVFNAGGSVPTITDVDTDEAWTDGDTGLPITGTNFC